MMREVMGRSGVRTPEELEVVHVGPFQETSTACWAHTALVLAANSIK